MLHRLTLNFIALTLSSAAMAHASTVFMDATAFPGSTADTQIANCLAAIPSGGVCDASRIGAGKQTWESTVTIKMGQTVIFASATIFVPGSESTQPLAIEAGGQILGDFVWSAPSGWNSAAVVTSGSIGPSGGLSARTHIERLHCLGLANGNSAGRCFEAEPTGNAYVAFLQVDGIEVQGMASGVRLVTEGNSYINGNTFANVFCMGTSNCIQLVPGGVTVNGSQISNNLFPNWSAQYSSGIPQTPISIVPATHGVGAVNNMFLDGNQYDQPSGNVVVFGIGTFRNVVTGALCIGGGSDNTYSDSGNSNQVIDTSPGCGTGAPGELNTYIPLYNQSGIRKGYISTSSGSVLPGSLTVTGRILQGGGDFAESVDMAGDRTSYSEGDLLVIDATAPGKFFKSAVPYSTLVAGIFSTKPGTIGRRQAAKESSDEVPMAIMGIVPAKVTAENGPIYAGDLLVSSSRPGYAMKGTDRNRMLGAVIGKALGTLDSGSGKIEVIVTLQ